MKERRLILIAAVVLASGWTSLGQTITWSGSGDATSWSDANNWVGNQVPGSANVALITNGAGTNVVISSPVTVESIQCDKALTISSGSVTLSAGSSLLQGMLTVASGATLSASGSGTRLTSTGLVEIDNASLYAIGGATLSLTGVAQYNHSVGADAVLQASGSGSVLALAGLTNVTGINSGSYYPLMIQAAAGGVINLSEMISSTNAVVQVEASGNGSEVDLSALRVFSGYMNEGEGLAELEATNGGTVLVGQLGTINQVDIAENDTGTLNLNSVTNMAGSTLIISSGALTLSNVANIDNASLYASGGATLSLPGAVAYNHSLGDNTVLQASGTGSVLALTGLAEVTGMNSGSYYPMQIEALAGGMINLDGLISSSNGVVQMEASGSGSELNLSSMRMFSGYMNEGEGFAQLQTSSGGAVLAGELGTVNAVDISNDGTGTLNLSAATNLAGSTVAISGGSVTLAHVTDIDNASLYVSGGATLSLPEVAEYDHSADDSTVFQASGTGSVLALIGLTNVTGMDSGSYNPLMVQALAGGMIHLGGVISFSNTIVQVAANGNGSEVDLSALRVFTGFVNEGDGYSQLQTSSGGAVLVGQLGAVNQVDISDDGTGLLNLSAVTNLSGTTLTVTNGAVTLTNVTDIDNASLYVSGGATLSLPRVTQYTHSDDYTTVFQSSGPGSVLALTALTNVSGTNSGSYNPLVVQALAGGLINLGGLVSSSYAVVQAEASGSGSELNLSALRLLSGYVNEGDGYSQLQASVGGTVLVGQLETINEVAISDDGTGSLNLNAATNIAGSTLTVSNVTLTLTNLADIDNASFYVTGGAGLFLPGVTACSHSANTVAVWQASGPGSLLAMTKLTQVTGTNAGSYYPLTIQALAGGMINLDGLISSSNAVLQMEASGSGSEVDLSMLSVLSGYVNEGEGFSELQASSGGTVLAGQLRTLNEVNVSYDGTGALSVNALVNFNGGAMTASGGSLELTNVANIAGADLYVTNGATLSLPGVINYAAGCADAVWQAAGAGSFLEMTRLTNLMGNTCGSLLDIQALAGGQVLLGDVQMITNGGVAFLSDGAGSGINLASLSDFVLQSGQGSVSAQNGGTLILNSQPLLLGNVSVNIPPGTPGLPPALIGASSLTLYANPWDSYRVEERNPLQPGAPLTTLLVPLTNSFQAFAAVPAANTTFLVTEFVANPPILQLGLTPDSQVQLVLFGETNATYQIQSTTNLHEPITWTAGSEAVMTNSFRIFPETPPGGLRQFYRAQQE